MENHNTSYEIYVITTENHWYVWSASGKKPFASRRFTEHMSGGNKCAARIRDLLKVCGPSAFQYEVLDSGVGDVIERERFWYDIGVVFEHRECLNAHAPGSYPDTNTGRTATLEARANMSRAAIGHAPTFIGPHSPETKAKTSAISKARGMPRHVTDAATAARIGKPSPLRGRKQSPDVVAMKAERQTGKPHPSAQPIAECADCGMISRAAPMGRHFKSTGHTKT